MPTPVADVLPASPLPLRRGGSADAWLSRSAGLSAAAGAACAVLGDPLWLTAWLSVAAICLGVVVVRREPGRLGGQIARSLGVTLLVLWALLRVVGWFSGDDLFVLPTLTEPA